MTASLSKLADGTLELTLVIPWSQVAKAYDGVVEEMVKSSQVTGFRKGKAPRKLIEEKLDKHQVYEEVLKKLIPQIYTEAVESHKLRPIVSPKIELKEASENKDWVIRALTCERPKLELGDYKKQIQELKAGKQKKIWVPGQEAAKTESTEKDRKPSLDELLTALSGVVKITLPGLLLDSEVNRLLADLIDQTKKLGLTVEQYLASTNRTAENLRSEYTEQAKKTLALEFALEEIANKEGIVVSENDIDNVIKTAKNESEKKVLEGQRYYLASILRRQKTLDFLTNL